MRNYRISSGIRQAILQTIPEHEPSSPSVEGSELVVKEFVTSDGVTYQVEFLRHHYAESKSGLMNIWLVSFHTPTTRKSRKTVEVMGKVAAAVKDFISTHHPAVLTFMGTTPSRDRLYESMLKRFVPGQWVRRGVGFALVLGEKAKKFYRL